MLTLYVGSTSVCSQKVRLVVAEKGLAWDCRMLDLTAGDQFDPEYMKLNPNAVVPTLVHDGRVVIESTVINEYLDDVFPEVPLRPADAYERARMRLWVKQLDEGIHYAINTVTFAIALRVPELKETPAEREARINSVPDPARREKMRELVEKGVDSGLVEGALVRLDRMLGDMEESLSASPWLAGAGYSLADAGFTPYVNRLDMLGLAAMWRAARPRVTDWFARCKARPNFAEAITKYDPPERIAMMNAAGAREWPKLEAKLADLGLPGGSGQSS